MKIRVSGKSYECTSITPKLVIGALDELNKFETVTENPKMAEALEDIAGFIAEQVFSGQFSRDDFLNGYRSEHVVTDMVLMLRAVCDEINIKLAEFPKPRTAGGQSKKK